MSQESSITLTPPPFHADSRIRMKLRGVLRLSTGALRKQGFRVQVRLWLGHGLGGEPIAKRLLMEAFWSLNGVPILSSGMWGSSWPKEIESSGF